ncbi:MAG TPA: aminotransferase class V-fold PLP-dependent enzyme [Anaerolineales bacterium]
MNELKAYKVRPASDELPYKFETGTQNHEGIAGVLGVLEYLEWVGKEFGTDQGSAWKEAGFSGRGLELKKGMSAMQVYETELSKALIRTIESVPGTRIYGITDLNRLDERVPTVSFTVEGKDPEQLAKAIGNKGIYMWNGHNYALAIVERLGLLEAGGMIRVGPVHYNTLDELDKFGEVLKKVAK